MAGWQALGTLVGPLPSWRDRLVRGEGEGQAPCRTAAAAETLVCPVLPVCPQLDCQSPSTLGPNSSPRPRCNSRTEVQILIAVMQLKINHTLHSSTMHQSRVVAVNEETARVLLHVSVSYRPSHHWAHQPTSSTTSGEAESRLLKAIEGHLHARHTRRLRNAGASMSRPAKIEQAGHTTSSQSQPGCWTRYLRATMA